MKMDKDNYGTIAGISSFTWDIPEFSVIVEEHEYHLRSPEFEFGNGSLYLSMKKGEDCGVTRFAICTASDYNVRRTPFYRLSIKDVKGKDYWTSSLMSHEVENELTEYLGQFHSWLKRDASRIAPGDILRLHLTFYQGDEPPPSEDAEHGQKHTSSDTTDARTKKCTDSFCNQGCSSNSFGLCKLSQNFKDMLLNREDCDATLDVKGRRFQVHAPILKSRSPVFAAMFRQEMLENTSRDVKIEDCDPEAFHEFVLYLYSGRLEKLDVGNVTSLHYIAHKYGVEDLAATCVRFMIHNMAVDNFCQFAEVGLRHCESVLMESVNVFLAENLKLVFATEKWKSFSLQNATEAYELAKKALAKNL